MAATMPATLAMFRNLQNLIVTNMGTSFAALSAADAARYGVNRAVFIGVPKILRDRDLPQCQLEPVNGRTMRIGQCGRLRDTVAARARVLVDFTDWWAAEQQILALRDNLLGLLTSHALAGAQPGGPIIALESIPVPPEPIPGAFGVPKNSVPLESWPDVTPSAGATGATGEFATMAVAGVSSEPGVAACG